MTYQEARDRIGNSDAVFLEDDFDVSLQRREDEAFAVHYRGVDIVTLFPNGDVQLRRGRSATRGVRKFINKYAPGIEVFIKKFKWYVRTDTVIEDNELISGVDDMPWEEGGVIGTTAAVEDTVERLLRAALTEILGDSTHSHTCKLCNFTWTHPDITMLLDTPAFDAAHRCKQCGRKVVMKDDG
jgi:hypothetical protein